MKLVKLLLNLFNTFIFKEKFTEQNLLKYGFVRREGVIDEGDEPFYYFEKVYKDELYSLITEANDERKDEYYAILFDELNDIFTIKNVFMLHLFEFSLGLT